MIVIENNWKKNTKMSVLYVEMARQTRPKAQGQYWLSSFLIFYHTYIYIHFLLKESLLIYTHEG